MLQIEKRGRIGANIKTKYPYPDPDSSPIRTDFRVGTSLNARNEPS